MKFWQAMKIVEEGGSVRRAGWRDDMVRIYATGGGQYHPQKYVLIQSKLGGTAHYVHKASELDFLEEDWEIVKTPSEAK
jgi:hypothetical protein